MLRIGNQYNVTLNSANFPIISLTLCNQFLRDFSLQNKVSGLGLCPEGNWYALLVVGAPVRFTTKPMWPTDRWKQCPVSYEPWHRPAASLLSWGNVMACWPDVPHFPRQPWFHLFCPTVPQVYWQWSTSHCVSQFLCQSDEEMQHSKGPGK